MPGQIIILRLDWLASGNGNIASFPAMNTSTVPVTATITVTPSAAGCAGPPETFTITVNPTPDVVQPPDQSLCSGNITSAVTFTGAVNGTVYNWTNTAVSIGLPATGSGNIAPFTAYSNGSSPSIATITVRPTAIGCPGPLKTFTITINPVPNLVQPPNQTLCNGATTNNITFTGSLSSANYTWTNSNPSIGLDPTGTGNIPAFTATNTTNAPVTATITVTPANGFCQGAAQNIYNNYHPTPAVVASNDTNVCLGSTAQLSATGASQYFWSPANQVKLYKLS